MNKESGSQPKFTTKTSLKVEPALYELFMDGIRDIYWAEQHLLQALPRMIRAASTPELAETIEQHLAETEIHVSRLEQIFELLKEKAIAKKCDAMEGLSKEGEAIIESTEEGTATRDVGIILASQKIEHYEIAAYGGLAQVAATLGMDEVAAILEETLKEEKNADRLLTDVAEKNINFKASEEA